MTIETQSETGARTPIDAFSAPAVQPAQEMLPAPVSAITPAIPSALAERLLILSDASLKNGAHLVAGPGSGKSRLLGRILVWQMLLRRKPQVILDPTGGVVDNLLDKLSRLPLEYRKKLWPRLVYVNAGATDFITPTPLYYRMSENDTLFEIANRPLAIFKRQDPQLESAPILGWNSIYECGIFAGQIAAALERQIDFVADLVRSPRNYKEDLKQVVSAHPELQPAVSYFREMMDPTSGELRNRRTSSFLTKLLPLLADPPMRAAFAAPSRHIDWEAISRQGQTLIIDFRHERDPERRRFKLLYWFRNFIDFVKYRGMAGRGEEVVFLIDEVTQLLGHRTLSGASIMAEDLEELVAVLGRNFGVNVVISHQNLSQVDERIRNVFMQMGTQLIGVLPNPDDAITVARYLASYDPHLIKKKEPVWMSLEYLDRKTYNTYMRPTVIDYRTVEFAVDEQIILAAQQLQRLPNFRFLVRPAKSEGNLTGRLRHMSIANVDRNQYPDERQIAPVRRMLAQRDGIPLATLLAELQNPVGDEETPPKPVKQKQASAILDPKLANPYGARGNSDATTTASVALPVAGPVMDDEATNEEGFWK